MPGCYFITICTENRLNLFGTWTKGIVYLNEGGEAVLNCWNQIPEHYSHVQLHQFIIMPNHVHGIIEITSVSDAGNSHIGNSRVGVQYFEHLHDDHTHGEPAEFNSNGMFMQIGNKRDDYPHCESLEMHNIGMDDQENLNVRIPHVDCSRVGVQNIEPLQDDHSHG